MISSAKKANLIFLDEEKNASYLPDSYGYPVEDVLLFRQESVSRPKIIKVHMDAVDAALEEDDFEKADKALSKLKDILGEDNTEYKRIAGIIDDAKLISIL